MLTELRVRDLAVIADVTLPFQPGLNVLTGETGAGKSMVVDALALLLGERASADVVRPGAEKTVVEGAFEFTSAIHRHLLPPFAALGIELEDGRLILKRSASRREVARVGERLAHYCRRARAGRRAARGPAWPARKAVAAPSPWPARHARRVRRRRRRARGRVRCVRATQRARAARGRADVEADRKSTRLNSSH